MSQALAIAPRVSPWRSTTVRRTLRALAWTLGLTLLFTVWHVIEKWGFSLGKHARLVRSPSLVPMLALGVPHFLIAALFLATSPRRASTRARAVLAGFLLLAIAAAAGYGWASADEARHKLPMAAVGLLFVVHQLRDESWLFLASEDGPRDLDPRRVRGFVDAWTTAFLFGVGAVYVLGLQGYNASKGRIGPMDLLGVALPYAALVLGGLGIAATASAWRLRAFLRDDPDGLRAWLPRIAPLLVVQGLFLGVVLVGTLSRTLLEALVLWHVLAWLFYALERIEATPRPGLPPRGLLARAKTTREGFLFLHLGLAALVFVAMLAWTYLQRKAPESALRIVADPRIFYYWTIFHVVTSFAPR